MQQLQLNFNSSPVTCSVDVMAVTMSIDSSSLITQSFLLSQQHFTKQLQSKDHQIMHYREELDAIMATLVALQEVKGEGEKSQYRQYINQLKQDIHLSNVMYMIFSNKVNGNIDLLSTKCVLRLAVVCDYTNLVFMNRLYMTCVTASTACVPLYICLCRYMQLASSTVQVIVTLP